jgi:predicted AlkP superfamily phosphohydrolase/phosphomutase
LLALTDPKTGEPVVDAVHLGRDLYHGPYADKAPDLVIEMAAPYFVRNSFDHSEFRLVYPAGRYGRRTLEHTGKHHPDGLLVAAGPAIQARGAVEGAHITDLAPTILYAMDLPVPTSLDGRVLTDLFEPAHIEANPVRYAATDSALQAQASAAYSEQESAALESHLQGLGYL